MIETPRNDLGLTDKGHACACAGAHSDVGAPRGTETTARTSGEALREHYLVSGMTCAHCVASVTEELTALDGVQSVHVDLNAGAASRVVVVSSRPVHVDKIRAAVTEAGYGLVPA